MFHWVGDVTDRWYDEALKMTSVTDECCGCTGVVSHEERRQEEESGNWSIPKGSV
jgi:hypothetical protein